VNAAADLHLAAAIDLGDDLAASIRDSAAQVAVDFTVPDCAARNTRAILEAGACPVVGTTGFTPGDIHELEALSLRLGRGGLIAPNFAVGAVLLMKFAAEAAKYFPDVEVIELHHDQKVDAPSGTALKTVELIRAGQAGAVSLPGASSPRPAEKEVVAGVRGGRYLGVPVHSVRLPGYVAHQEVLFGGPGQTLTLRHDSLARTSFMPGVLLAVRKVQRLERLYYGLERILDL
jgi:4-hydroxy-tetrahydrodipicolinate reductase